MPPSHPAAPRRLIPLLLALPLSTAAAAPAVPPPDSLRTMPVGLCEDYPEETRTIEQARRDFQVLRDSGITHLRISLGWDGIETEDDRFDWAFWDEFIAVATDEFGLVLLPYLCYTPAWAAEPGSTTPYAAPPLDPAEFAEFAGAAAARYRGRVPSWELWNEPDNPAYWTGTVEEYAALLEPAAAAVRAADPDADIVLGGIAWDLDWLTSLLRDHRAGPSIDIVNLHSYFETWSPEPAGAVRGYVNRAAEITELHGESEPLWMAEVGYSTFREGAHVSDQYRAAYAHEHTPGYQAAHLLKTVAMLAATQEIDLVAWYELRDLATDEPVIGDVNNRHLGVAGVHGEPKPALGALRLAHAIFSRPFRCIDGRVRITHRLESGAEIHCFEHADGAVVIIAWLRSAEPGSRPLRGDGSEQDPRRETVDLLLPGNFGGVRATDETGGPLTPPELAHTADRSTTLRGVELRPTSVLVLTLEPAG